MELNELLGRFASYGDRSAFVWREKAYSYRWLVRAIQAAADELQRLGIRRTVVSLEEDYSPFAAAALLALLRQRCIVLPIDRRLVNEKVQEWLAVGEAQARVWSSEDGLFAAACGAEGAEGAEGAGGVGVGGVKGAGGARGAERGVRHPLLAQLLLEEAPGIVLFSSGSAGKSKAAVHRADRLLAKYRDGGRPRVTIPFMMFDHIGGLNTLLQALASGGTLCIVEDRSPEEVCRTIEKRRVEALPVSPTFLNLLLLSGAYRRYDLSSLEVVSYGSEVMPPSTLAAWNERFPHVRTVQAYGMSELGVLATRSRSSDSLQFELKDGEAEFRIVDGLLEIKSESAMVGYLNAPSPFTEDGWLRTGDEAAFEDGYLRILGRRSEMINVGGEKVYPAEVEDALLGLEAIEEVVVGAERSGITGQLVKATVKLRPGVRMSLAELRRAIRAHCREKLPPYKIPQKIELTTDSLLGDRMKKVRRPAGLTTNDKRLAFSQTPIQ